MKADFQDPDEFERLVQRQALRRIPAAWRSEVLGAAQGARQASAGADARSESSVWRKVRAGFRSAAATLLWPSPAGWGALAAVWVILFVVNHQVAGQARPVAGSPLHGPAEISRAWREQERLLTELLGSRDTTEAVPASASPAGHLGGSSTDHSLLDSPKMNQQPA